MIENYNKFKINYIVNTAEAEAVHWWCQWICITHTNL